VAGAICGLFVEAVEGGQRGTLWQERDLARAIKERQLADAPPPPRGFDFETFPWETPPVRQLRAFLRTTFEGEALDPLRAARVIGADGFARLLIAKGLEHGFIEAAEGGDAPVVYRFTARLERTTAP
jgi:hypothetical protein